jgi:chlorite dismutase
VNPRLYTFVAGATGPWRIVSIAAVTGATLEAASHLDIRNGSDTGADRAQWILRGTTSNERYVARPEKQQLLGKQEGLGRPASTCAALIPIRKSEAWWSLTQDERREIFEERSHHTKIGLNYLPAIARRLHHCRDLAVPEAFDFLTWFEYAPADATAFEQLLQELRAAEEWKYVEREVDVRLTRAPA